MTPREAITNARSALERRSSPPALSAALEGVDNALSGTTRPTELQRLARRILQGTTTAITSGQPSHQLIDDVLNLVRFSHGKAPANKPGQPRQRWITIDRGGAPGQLKQCTRDPKRWLLRVSLGRDPRTGKRLSRDEIYYGGKKGAEARLNELLQLKYQDRLQQKSNLTIREVAEQWLEVKTRTVTPRTLAWYEGTLANYLLPTLGHIRVADLTLETIDDLYSELIDGNPEVASAYDGSGWSGQPLSARTIRIAHNHLSQVMDFAVKRGWIMRNPTEHATLPENTRTKKRRLTIQEHTRFIDACGSSFYGTFYRLMLETGVRPGEACALTWDDVNLQDGTINIDKAMTKGANGERVIGTPKTEGSVRTVFAPRLVGLLRAHQEQQIRNNLHSSGHVFTNMEGGALAPWTFNKRDLRRTLEAAGIDPKGISLYSFRHTFLTLTVNSDMQTKVASQLAGHTNLETTNIYLDPDVEVRREAALKHAAYLDAQEALIRQEGKVSN